MKHSFLFVFFATAFALSAVTGTTTGKEGGSCELPEFKACENCMNLDFHLKYFYGCGVVIKETSIKM